MSVPSELSFDEILKFMLMHNGKVTNHELVKHFKVFLTNPDMRDEARNTFKKHVNTLANIKNHNNEKWLILKKKYMTNNSKDTINDASCDERNSETTSLASTTPSNENERSNLEPIPYRHPPPPFPLSQDLNIAQFLIDNSQQVVNSPVSNQKENVHYHQEESAPKAYPRRKSSSDKTSIDKKSATTGSLTTLPHDVSIQDLSQNSEPLSTSKSEVSLEDNEHKISVKERKQMFNRMASEGDVNMKPVPVGSNFYNQSVDEEDRASIRSLDPKGESEPLDPKQKAWILCAARGEYHALAKMCSENSKVAKTKDPFTTAMHWACKRGDENLVKLLAGVARTLVNERSNGGYTPLHIAMQFRHENVYRLLVDVYDADANIRDWAGRKPQQYLKHEDTSLSPGSFRKSDKNDLHRTMTTPPSIRITHSNINDKHSKKESFLRIGSLNVRVKKTTEAFSNFLGVGGQRASAYAPKTPRVDEGRDDTDTLHKSWGSADNIPKDDKLMPPPLSSKVRRRAASGRKGLASHQSRSTPSTPDQARAQIGSKDEGDSDSDSAAGFHAAWRQQRASDCLS